MKVGRVHLGQGITVGGNATVLYDTNVGDFAQIGPLSIIMKGETIPAHSAWHGAPAQTMTADEGGDDPASMQPQLAAATDSSGLFKQAS